MKATDITLTIGYAPTRFDNVGYLKISKLIFGILTSITFRDQEKNGKSKILRLFEKY